MIIFTYHKALMRIKRDNVYKIENLNIKYLFATFQGFS